MILQIQHGQRQSNVWLLVAASASIIFCYCDKAPQPMQFVERA